MVKVTHNMCDLFSFTSVIFAAMESKRQKQVASDIQRIVGEAFLNEAREYLKGAFVTISHVSLTSDLYVARINISVLQKEKEQEVLESLQENNSVIRKIVGNQLKNKIRSIPTVEFFIDNSLEKVFEIERLLKEAKSTNEEE